MRHSRAFACAITLAMVIGGCLFPSTDGLEASGDAAVDVISNDGASSPDAGSDAKADADASDPTLILHYTFDEGMDVVAHDSSGHGFDALITGANAASVWTTGHTGEAILFNPGDTDCVNVISSNANQSGPLTVTAWVNMVTDNSGGGYIIGQRHQAGFSWRVDIEPDDAGAHLGFAIGTGDDAGDDFNALTLIPPTGWHHVAGVFDPSVPTQSIFIDGVKTVSTQPAASIILDPIASTIRIGCRGDDSFFFDGIIDEVRVYSRALGDGEISALATP